MKSSFIRLCLSVVLCAAVSGCAGPTVFSNLSDMARDKKNSQVPPPPEDTTIAADGTLAYPSVNGRPGALTPAGQQAARAELDALTQQGNSAPIALVPSEGAETVEDIAAERTARAEAQIAAESERLQAENSAEIAELERRLEEAANALATTECPLPPDASDDQKKEQDC